MPSPLWTSHLGPPLKVELNRTDLALNGLVHPLHRAQVLHIGRTLLLGRAEEVAAKRFNIFGHILATLVNFVPALTDVGQTWSTFCWIWRPVHPQTAQLFFSNDFQAFSERLLTG